MSAIQAADVPTLNQSTTGNAATATTLQTARTIGGVSFNGSANINLPGVNTAGNQNTTGSAATLTTARTIGGVSFNGSANINLPGVNTAGNQNTTGSAATLTTGRTIAITGDLTYTSGSFNGSANVTGTGTLANSGVTAGSYTVASITVDAKGRVTAASTGSAPAPTTAQVLDATAGATAGAVGTYAFMTAGAGTRSPGATLAGGSLQFCGIEIGQTGFTSGRAWTGGAASGTWRLMGYNRTDFGGSGSPSLWLRIS
jgi:hypothetical protein